MMEERKTSMLIQQSHILLLLAHFSDVIVVLESVASYNRDHIDIETLGVPLDPKSRHCEQDNHEQIDCNLKWKEMMLKLKIDTTYRDA